MMLTDNLEEFASDPSLTMPPCLGSTARTVLQQEVWNLETEKMDMLHAIQQIEAKISCLQIKLATIALLPPEILSKIFILCRPDEFRFRFGHLGSVKYNVLAVCQRWRAVAYDTPLLWSKMEFCFGNYFPDELSPSEKSRNFDTWLQRATSDISITWSQKEPALFERLVSKSACWRSLYFSGQEPERSRLSCSDVSFESLVQLEIASIARETDESVKTILFPRLQTLIVLHSSSTRWIKAPMLHSLEIRMLTGKEWHSIGTDYPLLQSLEIHSCNEELRVSEGSQAFPSLNSLKLKPLLDCHIGLASMPRLRSLRLETNIPSCRNSSAKSLENLELHNVTVTLRSRCLLEDLFNSQPSLRTIAIYRTIWAEIFTKVFEVLVDESICPNLEHVILNNSVIEPKSILSFSRIRSSSMDRRCLVTLERCRWATNRCAVLDVKGADYAVLSASEEKET